MSFRRTTLDLKDRVSEMDDRLEEIKEEKEDLQVELREQMNDEGVDELQDVSDWDEYEDDWEELESEHIELEGDRWKFIETVADWKGGIDLAEDPDDEEVKEAYGTVDRCEFVVKELSFGQVQSVNDDMMEKSFDVDMQSQDIEGTPKQGYFQVEMIREAVERWPDGSPVRQDEYNRKEPAPGDYPTAVGEWLFDKVNAFNTTQSTDMGNSSLEEAMKSKK